MIVRCPEHGRGDEFVGRYRTAPRRPTSHRRAWQRALADDIVGTHLTRPEDLAGVLELEDRRGRRVPVHAVDDEEHGTVAEQAERDLDARHMGAPGTPQDVCGVVDEARIELRHSEDR